MERLIALHLIYQADIADDHLKHMAYFYDSDEEESKWST